MTVCVSTSPHRDSCQNTPPAPHLLFFHHLFQAMQLRWPLFKGAITLRDLPEVLRRTTLDVNCLFSIMPAGDVLLSLTRKIKHYPGVPQTFESTSTYARLIFCRVRLVSNDEHKGPKDSRTTLANGKDNIQNVVASLMHWEIVDSCTGYEFEKCKRELEQPRT